MAAAESLAARRNLQFTDELLESTRTGFRLLQERVRQGAAPALEESLLLVEVNRLEGSRHLLQGRRQVADLKLRLVAGLPPSEPLAVRGDLSRGVPPFDREAAVRRALVARPDVEASRAETAMARAMVRKEQAEGRWDASLRLSYQRMESGFDLLGETESGERMPIMDTFHFFGAGLSIMLPVRNRNQGNVAAAVAGAEGAGRRLEYAELTVRQEVEAAFARYEAAQRALETYRRGVRDVARRNLDVVWRAYELGRTSLLDAIQEHHRYIEIETGYTESLREAFEAAVEIERAIDVPDS